MSRQVLRALSLLLAVIQTAAASPVYDFSPARDGSKPRTLICVQALSEALVFGRLRLLSATARFRIRRLIGRATPASPEGDGIVSLLDDMWRRWWGVRAAKELTRKVRQTHRIVDLPSWAPRNALQSDRLQLIRDGLELYERDPFSTRLRQLTLRDIRLVPSQGHYGPESHWHQLVYMDADGKIVIHEEFLRWLSGHAASRNDAVVYLSDVLGHENFERSSTHKDAHRMALEMFRYSRIVQEALLNDQPLPPIRDGALATLPQRPENASVRKALFDALRPFIDEAYQRAAFFRTATSRSLPVADVYKTPMSVDVVVPMSFRLRQSGWPATAAFCHSANYWAILLKIHDRLWVCDPTWQSFLGEEASKSKWPEVALVEQSEVENAKFSEMGSVPNENRDVWRVILEDYVAIHADEPVRGNGHLFDRNFLKLLQSRYADNTPPDLPLMFDLLNVFDTTQAAETMAELWFHLGPRQRPLVLLSALRSVIERLDELPAAPALALRRMIESYFYDEPPRSLRHRAGESAQALWERLALWLAKMSPLNPTRDDKMVRIGNWIESRRARLALETRADFAQLREEACDTIDAFLKKAMPSDNLANLREEFLEARSNHQMTVETFLPIVILWISALERERRAPQEQIQRDITDEAIIELTGIKEALLTLSRKARSYRVPGGRDSKGISALDFKDVPVDMLYDFEHGELNVSLFEELIERAASRVAEGARADVVGEMRWARSGKAGHVGIAVRGPLGREITPDEFAREMNSLIRQTFGDQAAMSSFIRLDNGSSSERATLLMGNGASAARLYVDWRRSAGPEFKTFGEEPTVSNVRAYLEAEYYLGRDESRYQSLLEKYGAALNDPWGLAPAVSRFWGEPAQQARRAFIREQVAAYAHGGREARAGVADRRASATRPFNVHRDIHWQRDSEYRSLRGSVAQAIKQFRRNGFIPYAPIPASMLSSLLLDADRIFYADHLPGSLRAQHLSSGKTVVLVDRSLRFLFDADGRYVQSRTPQERAAISAFLYAKLIHELAEILMEPHDAVAWRKGESDPHLADSEAVAYSEELKALKRVPGFVPEFFSLLNGRPPLAQLYETLVEGDQTLSLEKFLRRLGIFYEMHSDIIEELGRFIHRQALTLFAVDARAPHCRSQGRDSDASA